MCRTTGPPTATLPRDEQDASDQPAGTIADGRESVARPSRVSRQSIARRTKGARVDGYGLQSLLNPSLSSPGRPAALTCDRFGHKH